MTLIRIDARHAVYGVEINERGFVIKAAPIGRWMTGRPWSEVERWLERRGYSWQRAETDSEQTT